MKFTSPHLKNFAEALLGLSQEALVFSRDYVKRSPKETRNPDLVLFFEHALTVVQEFQRQLHVPPKAPSKKQTRRKTAAKKKLRVKR